MHMFQLYPNIKHTLFQFTVPLQYNYHNTYTKTYLICEWKILPMHDVKLKHGYRAMLHEIIIIKIIILTLKLHLTR